MSDFTLKLIGLFCVVVIICSVHCLLFGRRVQKGNWNVVCIPQDGTFPNGRIERINIPLEVAEDYQKRNQKNNPNRVYLLEPYQG